VQREIATATAPLRQCAPELGWTAEDRLHLTLKFLGEQAESRVDALAETLAVMSARVVPDASITVPLDGRRLDQEGIVADAAVSSALKSVLAALAAASRETRTV